MFTLYTLGDRDGRGLYCSKDGLSYGGVTLVAKSAKGVFAPVALEGVLKSALAVKAAGIQAVANALNDGQLARAMIIAVNLGLPPLTRADIAKLRKWSFNPDEPRDAQGRWTTGDDDSSEANHGSGTTQAQLIPVQEFMLDTVPWDLLDPDTAPDLDAPSAGSRTYQPPEPPVGPFLIPPDLSEEENEDCEKQWENAEKFCNNLRDEGYFKQPRAVFGFGRTLGQCLRGQVSEKCGGNVKDDEIA